MAWGKFRTDYRRVKKVEFDGYRFDSAAERRHYEDIKLREKAGECELLGTQVRVKVCCKGTCNHNMKIEYIADFLIFDKKINQEVYEELKGFETQIYRLKRRLYMHTGQKILRVFRPTKSGSVLVEEFIPSEVIIQTE